jgi:hypothetical protein
MVHSAITNDLHVTGSAPMYACRAWVNFDGTQSTPTIRSSGNISSVSKSQTGVYTVNFTTAMQDTNYCVSGTASVSGNKIILFVSTGGINASSVTVETAINGGTVSDLDASSVFVAIHR